MNFKGSVLIILICMLGCSQTPNNTRSPLDTILKDSTGSYFSTDSIILHSSIGDDFHIELQRNTSNQAVAWIRISKNKSNSITLPVFSGDGMFDTIITVGFAHFCSTQIVEIDSSNFLLSLQNWSGSATYHLYITDSIAKFIPPRNEDGVESENMYLVSNYKVVYDSTSRSLYALNYSRGQNTNTRVYNYSGSFFMIKNKIRFSSELMYQLDSSKDCHDGVYKLITTISKSD
jgi:hypothetical protein